MSIFKAYDIRGVYPAEIGEDIVRRIGNGFAAFLRPAPGRPIVVGRDMRTSSVPLGEALMEGIRDCGVDVVDIGLATTPLLYHATGSFGAAGGIMVTASHNPARYNGLKLCREDAIPVGSASGLGEVEAAVNRGDYERVERRGGVVTKSALESYGEMIARSAAAVRPLKVGLDAGNGAVGPFLARLLKPFPISVVPLYLEPDGAFPNHEANPLEVANLRDLIEVVRREGCDLGCAFDGDGDRAAFVDEKGGVISGDMTTALIARSILQKEKGPVVYDLRSSRAVREEIERWGGVPIVERVGHAFMKATMRRTGALFAGEVSGHFYFRDNFCTESAVLALARMLAIVTAADRPLSAIVAEVDRYPRTGEVNFHVEDKDGAIARLARVFGDGRISRLDGITVEYDDWWFNVRKSNTEPLLRLNLEASTRDGLERARARVVEAIGAPPAGHGGA